MNILILTGKFGMGHWAASQSLRQQLLGTFPDAAVTVEDFPAYVMPNASEVLYKFFHLVVTRGSFLFNAYYNLTAQGHTDARAPLEGLFLDKLAELLEQHRPDAVIATHPLCAQIVSRLKEEAVQKEHCYLDLPLFTCITDVSSHPEWINRNTDCYLVPNREVRISLEEKGVLPARIRVTGIPVREEFRSLTRRRAWLKCGGQRDAELLVMGGGLGLLPLDESFYETLDRIPDTHTTIITGCNEKLRRHLAGRWKNIEVLGYVDRVWEYLEKSDMIVTKQGGITLFESIFAQVPIYSWRPALCQEQGNARWIVDKEIGWVAGTGAEECAGEIREILMDEKRLARAAARMDRVKQELEVDALSHLMAAVAGSQEVA